MFNRRTPLGWLQLSHQKSKLIVALAGIAFADILMFTQLGFRDALFDSSVRTHQILDTDVVLFSPQALNFGNLATFPRRRLLQAQDITGVQSAHGLYVNNVVWKHPQTRKENAIRVIGIDPDFVAFSLRVWGCFQTTLFIYNPCADWTPVISCACNSRRRGKVARLPKFKAWGLNRTTSVSRI